MPTHIKNQKNSLFGCAKRMGDPRRGHNEVDYPFKDKEEARKFFTELTRLLKNLNYVLQGSAEYTAYLTQIEDLVKTLGRTSTASTKTPA
jgi:hypothetical protein